MIIHARGAANDFGHRNTAAELAQNCFYMLRMTYPDVGLNVLAIGKTKAHVTLRNASSAARKRFKRILWASCPWAQIGGEGKP